MKSAKQGKTAGNTSKKATTIDAAALKAATKSHPGRSGRGGRTFSADPVPAGFHIIVDPNKNPTQPWRDLPAPTGLAPFHLSLDSVLSAEAMATINNSETMVFHAVGDTGGVNTPTQIENVAGYMEKDFAGPDITAHPSFFYHLGDVIYYCGETQNYHPEFYEPCINYPAPIFAGSHRACAQLSTLHRHVGGQSVLFIVAGAGGYNLRLHTLSKAFHKAKLPIEMAGSDGRLEKFCDSQHGYLKITVTMGKMVAEYFAVPDPSASATKALSPFDTLEIGSSIPTGISVGMRCTRK